MQIRQNKTMTISGWVLAVLISGLLLFSASMKFMNAPEFAKMFTEHFGYPPGARLGIAIAETATALLLLFPRLAPLGGVLMAGYMGGAIATHVRVGEPFFMQALFGILAWLSIYLRDQRVRSILPIA